MTTTNIEPSLADATALRTEVHNGRLRYVVHGIAVVYSLDAALGLLEDTRVAPQSPHNRVFDCCGGAAAPFHQQFVCGTLDHIPGIPAIATA